MYVVPKYEFEEILPNSLRCMLVGGLKLPQAKRTVEAILRIDVGVSFLSE